MKVAVTALRGVFGVCYGSGMGESEGVLALGDGAFPGLFSRVENTSE